MLLHNTGRPPLRCVQVLLEGLPNLSKLPGTRSAQSQAFVACPQQKRGQQNTHGSWESRTWVTWGTFFFKVGNKQKKTGKQHGKPQGFPLWCDCRPVLPHGPITQQLARLQGKILIWLCPPKLNSDSWRSGGFAWEVDFRSVMIFPAFSLGVSCYLWGFPTATEPIWAN